MSIRLGPAGSEGLGNLKGAQKVARMKLDCMEVAFTYGVRMIPEEAEALGAVARAKGIILSVHAPYYINLAATDKTTPTFFRPLAEALVARELDVTLISESPQPYKGAAMMKRVIRQLLNPAGG